jgi:hypothetical protein
MMKISAKSEQLSPLGLRGLVLNKWTTAFKNGDPSSARPYDSLLTLK